MARRISVELVGDSRDLERAFKRASRAGSGFNKTISALGKVGIGGAAVGFGVLAVAMKRGFGEFMDAQKVAAQTAAVLKSTGGVANVTAKHVDVLAGALSRMSSIDDEAIAAGENMLLTFTNIRNAVGKGPKIFDKATLAVLDMSVAMGKDIPSTAIMVGKALNDTTVNAKGTITGWSALRRVGVQVTPTMMKMAAAFIKAGQPMKAQLLLLKELRTEFGGSGRQFGLTLTGQFNKLRNALDEVTGAFAEGLAPVVQRVVTLLGDKMANPAFVARVRELGRLVGEKLYNAFQSISQWFQAHWGEIKSALKTAADVSRRFADALRAVVNITPGGANTLIGLIMSGILLGKIRKLGAAFGLTGLAGAAGGKGKGGKGGLPLFGINPVTATAAAVLSAGGGGTHRGARSGGFPLTVAAVKAAARGNLGPKALAVLKDSLDQYSLANAPTKKMAEAERRLKKLYASNRAGISGNFDNRRAGGGPVMAGVSYLVGERGPETFVPSSSGTVIPDGGGLTITGPINLYGIQSPRRFLEELQRIGKTGSSSTRGRYGGQGLAST